MSKSKDMPGSETIPDWAVETLNDYLSRVNPEARVYALIHIAARATASAIWKVKGEVEPESIFDTFREIVIGDLRERGERMQAKVSAINIQSQAAA